MDFETLERRFRVLFRFCGLTHFSGHFKEASSWRTRFGESFPAICYLLILSSMYSSALYFRYGFSNFGGTVKTIIAYTNISSEVFLQFTIIGQSLMNRDKLTKLYRTYQFIQKYLRTRTDNDSIQFNEFRTQIYQLMILVFGPSLITIVLRQTLLTNHTNVPFNRIVLAFYLLSSLAQMHVIIHMELLKFFLTLTKQWLQTRSSTFSTKTLYEQSNSLKVHFLNGYTEILHLKLIHYKLWEVSIYLNQIFGWCLGAIFVRNFIEMAYGAYWIYLHSSGGKYLFATRETYNPNWCIISVHLWLFSTFFSNTWIGPICVFLTSTISTILLINACHFCSVQVRILMLLNNYIENQTFLIHCRNWNSSETWRNSHSGRAKTARHTSRSKSCYRRSIICMYQ